MPQVDRLQFFPEAPDREAGAGIDVEFFATAAITAKDWVSISTTTTHGVGRHVIQMKDATETPLSAALCAGVAMHGCAAGEKVKVRVYGVVQGANVATGTAVGELLTNGTVDGRAIAAAQAANATEAGATIGVCLTLAASNSATVFVKCM